MPYNTRDIAQLEQEAMQKKKNEQKAKATVEEALTQATPQNRYQQMHDQQDLNGK